MDGFKKRCIERYKAIELSMSQVQDMMEKHPTDGRLIHRYNRLVDRLSDAEEDYHLACLLGDGE